MKKIAGCRGTDQFNQLFELWQRALPILSGSRYTHYCYTFGMRNVKGKPKRSRMIPCRIRHERPSICFLWKELGEYYRLELRLLIAGKIHQIPDHYNSAFFAILCPAPREYVLLNSVADWELFRFFQKHQFQLLVLKKHFKGRFKDFVDQLKIAYPFIMR